MILTARVSCELNQLCSRIRIRDLAEEFQELQPLLNKIQIAVFGLNASIAERQPKQGRPCEEGAVG